MNEFSRLFSIKIIDVNLVINDFVFYYYISNFFLEKPICFVIFSYRSVYDK